MAKLRKKSHRINENKSSLKKTSNKFGKNLDSNRVNLNGNTIEKTFNLTIKNGKLLVDGMVINETSEKVFRFGIHIKRNADINIIKTDSIDEVPSREKTINQLVDDAWRKCKKDRKNTNAVLREGDIVMAKLKGYALEQTDN